MSATEEQNMALGVRSVYCIQESQRLTDQKDSSYAL